MYTKEMLKKQLKDMGLNGTETIMVHSSMKSLGEVENGADCVVDALMEFFKDGLLLLPTHTWDQMSEEYNVFDRSTEPACVGIIPNVFMKREGVVRSLHPTHSVAAYGRRAEEYIKGEENSTTPCSPKGCFGRLKDENAKILLIGVTHIRNTFIHSIEESFDVPDRFTENTTKFHIVMPDGSKKTVDMYRHYNKVAEERNQVISDNFDKMKEGYFKTKAAKAVKLGDAECILCDAKKLFKVTKRVLKKDKDAFIGRDVIPAKWYKKSKIKTALVSLAIAFAVVNFIVAPVVSAVIYEGIFSRRYETVQWLGFDVSDFSGLKVENCTFESNEGQKLAGYKYSKDNQDVNGVVIIAHGLGGGGQNSYMNVADYFTTNGYLVFAYDATGNDNSEGKDSEGLPQGIIDLEHAISYVKEQEEYANLPIMLFGHSWGAYSSGVVLNFHKDISAVVMVAGPNHSTDLIEQEGEVVVGPFVEFCTMYVNLYEKLKFGKYAFPTAVDGFEASEAGVMIIHSSDDETVKKERGYDIFYKEYKDSDRFTFIEYTDRGHSYVLNSDDAAKYREQIKADYLKYVNEHGGIHNAEIKKEFMDIYLDKSKCFELDEELMRDILEFYNEYIDRQ